MFEGVHWGFGLLIVVALTFVFARSQWGAQLGSKVGLG